VLGGALSRAPPRTRRELDPAHAVGAGAGSEGGHRRSGPHTELMRLSRSDRSHHACRQVCMHADLEQTRIHMARARPGQARGAAPSRRSPQTSAWASARSRAQPTRCPAPAPPAPQSAGTASRPAPAPERACSTAERLGLSGRACCEPACAKPLNAYMQQRSGLGLSWQSLMRHAHITPVSWQPILGC